MASSFQGKKRSAHGDPIYLPHKLQLSWQTMGQVNIFTNPQQVIPLCNMSLISARAKIPRQKELVVQLLFFQRKPLRVALCKMFSVCATMHSLPPDQGIVWDRNTAKKKNVYVLAEEYMFAGLHCALLRECM